MADRWNVQRYKCRLIVHRNAMIWHCWFDFNSLQTQTEVNWTVWANKLCVCVFAFAIPCDILLLQINLVLFCFFLLISFKLFHSQKLSLLAVNHFDCVPPRLNKRMNMIVSQRINANCNCKAEWLRTLDFNCASHVHISPRITAWSVLRHACIQSKSNTRVSKLGTKSNHLSSSECRVLSEH